VAELGFVGLVVVCMCGFWWLCAIVELGGLGFLDMQVTMIVLVVMRFLLELVEFSQV